MEQKLAEAQERLEKYKGYQQVIADFPGIVIEVVADKEYENTEDMAECLDEGIIPHVITDDGKDGYEIEIPYEEADEAIDLKVLFEARHSEDLTKNVLIGASFWNNKKNTGVHLLSPERDKEGDCIIIFLQESVYFIQFSMCREKIVVFVS